MTLLEVCEPLFQYVCRISRSAKSGAHFEATRVHSDIEALLSQMRSQATSQPGLVQQFEKVEMPLVFFLDYMIKEGPFDFASSWREMGVERGELAGDEQFFDFLQETLVDTHPDVIERLEVFYTCLGLGFEGVYHGQPEQLHVKVQEIWTRLRDANRLNESGRRNTVALVGETTLSVDHLCPDAYKADTRLLQLDIRGRIGGLLILIISMLLVLFVLNGYLYHRASSDLRDALHRIHSDVGVSQSSLEGQP